MLLVLALTLVTLVASRSLLGGDRLGGGALVPVTGSAADLWAFYTGGSAGLGAAVRGGAGGAVPACLRADGSGGVGAAPRRGAPGGGVRVPRHPPPDHPP
ncbi:hypothetical protein ACFSTC_49250 [Nonomuraea ferruginea]